MGQSFIDTLFRKTLAGFRGVPNAGKVIRVGDDGEFEATDDIVANVRIPSVTKTVADAEVAVADGRLRVVEATDGFTPYRELRVDDGTTTGSLKTSQANYAKFRMDSRGASVSALTGQEIEDIKIADASAFGAAFNFVRLEGDLGQITDDTGDPNGEPVALKVPTGGVYEISWNILFFENTGFRLAAVGGGSGGVAIPTPATTFTSNNPNYVYASSNTIANGSTPTVTELQTFCLKLQEQIELLQVYLRQRAITPQGSTFYPYPGGFVQGIEAGFIGTSTPFQLIGMRYTMALGTTVTFLGTRELTVRRIR